MTPLNKVGIEVSYAIENFVHSLESYFVVSQPFLSNVWWIPYYCIKSPALLTFLSIIKYFGELKLPMEEAFSLGECQCGFYRVLILLVGFTVVVVDDGSG